jgi:hypothetical protein
MRFNRKTQQRKNRECARIDANKEDSFASIRVHLWLTNFPRGTVRRSILLLFFLFLRSLRSFAAISCGVIRVDSLLSAIDFQSV